MSNRTVNILAATVVVAFIVAFAAGGTSLVKNANKQREQRMARQIRSTTRTNDFVFTSTLFSSPDTRYRFDIQEFQYKGHAYIFLGSQSSLEHAAHCPCLSTNK